MDPSLYDEFGNYIGPDLDNNDDILDHISIDPENERQFNSTNPPSLPDQDQDIIMDDDIPVNALVLNEDKDYYPSASEVYGEHVQILVQDEDAQPLSVPVIAPIRHISFTHGLLDSIPEFSYSTQFMLDLTHHPSLIRTIAIVGSIHHGKTTLVDMLIEQTHPNLRWDLAKTLRYTDTHPMERDRGLSIKTSPVSLVLPTLCDKKHHLFHFLDTPGHVDFIDEVACGLQLADGAMVVVDVVEGLMANTQRILRRIVQLQMPFTLVINKIDRLVLELRLPPIDAYFKMRHVIEEVNAFVASLGLDNDAVNQMRLSPERNNVCFASAHFGFCFTLRSFAQLYADTHPEIDIEPFAQRLWGDIVFNAKTRKFQRYTSTTLIDEDEENGPSFTNIRSFQYFILEPLYKLFSIAIGESADHIKSVLKTLNIPIKVSELTMDVEPSLRLIMTRFFGKASGLVEMCVNSIPSAEDASTMWAQRWYTGSRAEPEFKFIAQGDPDAPLVLHVTKLYPRAIDTVNDLDGSSLANDSVGFAKGTTVAFDVLARVICGKVQTGMSVFVLGEKYTLEDEEDAARATITSVKLFNSRYSIPIPPEMALGPGNLVTLSGIEATILKSATVIEARAKGHVSIMSPVKLLGEPIVKVAIEPVNPSELPKMLAGLRHINRAYPMVLTRVLESGEHIVQGPGELYLDCVLHDLRKQYAEIDVKVSDPVTSLAETIVETSALKCFAESSNKKNKLTMIAEPLTGPLVDAIESGIVSVDMGVKDLSKKLHEEYEWDVLAARSVWAFGPEDRPCNVLVDDTLVMDTDKSALQHVRESVVRGFVWGSRDGPLCEESMRNVKFRLLNAEVSSTPLYRSGGQIIPMTRRLIHSSFLMAKPRIMEPVYAVEILTSADATSAIYSVLARRRGHVIHEQPKPGTPLYVVKALIPAMDAFGFETDLRAHTQGMAFPQSYFDHYQVVPGDPLDKSIVLKPLEPASTLHLARDFMIKTRRRKGLSEDVSVAPLFDDPMMLEMARNPLRIIHNYLSTMTTPPQHATLAAGCFWGVEHLFDKHYKNKGILSTEVGYSQGSIKNPTYRQVCSGSTNHAEVLRIKYDPQVLPFEEIVTFFFRIHDPTTLNKQGPDTGSQYRSGIYYESDQQRETAVRVKDKVQKHFKAPIVTEIAPLSNYFKAEADHQQYLFNNPSGYECPSHYVRQFPVD